MRINIRNSSLLSRKETEKALMSCKINDCSYKVLKSNPSELLHLIYSHNVPYLTHKDEKQKGLSHLFRL